MKYILLALIILTTIVVMMDPSFAQGSKNKPEAITFGAMVVFQPVNQTHEIPQNNVSFPVGGFTCETRLTDTSVIGECSKAGATVAIIANCAESKEESSAMILRLSDTNASYLASFHVYCNAK